MLQYEIWAAMTGFWWVCFAILIVLAFGEAVGRNRGAEGEAVRWMVEATGDRASSGCDRHQQRIRGVARGRQDEVGEKEDFLMQIVEGRGVGGRTTVVEVDDGMEVPDGLWVWPADG